MKTHILNISLFNTSRLSENKAVSITKIKSLAICGKKNMQYLLSPAQERILAYPTSYHCNCFHYLFNGNNYKALTLVLDVSDHTHYCCKFLKKEMHRQESSHFSAALIIKYLYVLKIC